MRHLTTLWPASMLLASCVLPESTYPISELDRSCAISSQQPVAMDVPIVGMSADEALALASSLLVGVEQEYASERDGQVSFRDAPFLAVDAAGGAEQRHQDDEVAGACLPGRQGMIGVYVELLGDVLSSDVQLNGALHWSGPSADQLWLELDMPVAGHPTLNDEASAAGCSGDVETLRTTLVRTYEVQTPLSKPGFEIHGEQRCSPEVLWVQAL